MSGYQSPGVYVQEMPSGSMPIEGVGTAIAALAGFTPPIRALVVGRRKAEGKRRGVDLGQVPEQRRAGMTSEEMDATKEWVPTARYKDPHLPYLVTNWAQFVNAFGDFNEFTGLGILPLSVYSFFQNGGGKVYVVPITPETANGSEPAALEAPRAKAVVGRLSIEANEPGPEGDGIEVKLEAGSGGDGAPAEPVKVTITKNGAVVFERDNASYASSGKDQRVDRVVNTGQQEVKTEYTAAADAVFSTIRLTGGAPVPLPPFQFAPDQSADLYTGDIRARRGTDALEAFGDVTMVSVPDLMWALAEGYITAPQAHAVQAGITAHCEGMGNRMAILDTPFDLGGPDEVNEYLTSSQLSSPYATMYWPWVKVSDPRDGRMRFIPPSGAMAGIWSRSDDTRGVHKAPANEVVRGAVEIERNITKGEHDILDAGVNCIRAFPGHGIRVWGARTLAGTSAPDWKYINVRRLFNYVEESILVGTQWAVFEPNDHALWARIRRSVSAFLVMEWRKGALFGSTPDEAFYVKCDDETNPTEAIDNGIVSCEIGVSPVKPAEFVVFKLSQISAGKSLVAE